MQSRTECWHAKVNVTPCELVPGPEPIMQSSGARHVALCSRGHGQRTAVFYHEALVEAPVHLRALPSISRPGGQQLCRRTPARPRPAAAQAAARQKRMLRLPAERRQQGAVAPAPALPCPRPQSQPRGAGRAGGRGGRGRAASARAPGPCRTSRAACRRARRAGSSRTGRSSPARAPGGRGARPARAVD